MSKKTTRLRLETYIQRNSLTLNVTPPPKDAAMESEPNLIEHFVIKIDGKPRSKARPRFTSQGRTYTPAATVAAEREIALEWRRLNPGRAPHLGAVSLELIATFEPPKSWSKKKRALALAGELPHLTKPDIDNMLKLAKDALNGHAYRDDSQVTNVGGSKQYGVKDSTLLRITFKPVTNPERKSNE